MSILEVFIMEPAIAAALISAGATSLSAGGGILSNLLGNRANRAIAEANRDAILTSNRENIAFQKEENELTRLREDNAVQRSAADMQAAGLSKTLAAGSPASAAALTAPKVQAATLDHKEQNLLKNVDLASTFTNLIQAVANVKKTTAETDSINISNQFAEEKAKSDIEYTNAGTEERKAQAALVEQTGKQNAIKFNYEIDDLIVSLDNKKLTGKQISEQTAKIISERYHVDKQTEYLIEQIAESKIKQKGMQHNVDYATFFGLPVGSIPNGLLGSALNAGQYIGHMLGNLALSFLNR